MSESTALAPSVDKVELDKDAHKLFTLELGSTNRDVRWQLVLAHTDGSTTTVSPSSTGIDTDGSAYHVYDVTPQKNVVSMILKLHIGNYGDLSVLKFENTQGNVMDADKHYTFKLNIALGVALQTS